MILNLASSTALNIKIRVSLHTNLHPHVNNVHMVPPQRIDVRNEDISSLVTRLHERFRVGPEHRLGLFDSRNQLVLDSGILQHGQQIFLAKIQDDTALSGTKTRQKQPERYDLGRFSADPSSRLAGRPGYDRMKELLSPMSPEVFFDKYWEMEHLLVARGDTGHS